jgi:hypothetical protein
MEKIMLKDYQNSIIKTQVKNDPIFKNSPGFSIIKKFSTES